MPSLMPPRVELRTMPFVAAAPATSRLIIDVEIRSEPISGQVRVGLAPPQAFTGWTVLAEAIEKARRGADEEGAHQPCAQHD
jgi:hypothetical protein